MRISDWSSDVCSSDLLLLQTARRVQGERFSAPLIICNEEHRFLIAALFQRAAISPSGIILEAEGRSTGPAAAVAALFVLSQEAEEVDPLLLLLPADHVIPDVGAFQDPLLEGVAAARHGRFVTFGIRSEEPTLETQSLMRIALPVFSI